MPTTFPFAWLFLGLPFVSSAVIMQVPALIRLATAKNRVTWPLGIAALVWMLTELVGIVPSTFGLILLAGALSGFAMIWAPRHDDGGGDDGSDRWHPGGGGPPDDSPPPPRDDGPSLDWDEFDRLRVLWDRQPVLHG